MTFAIQPVAWGSFDSYGCDWASSIEQAYRIGKQWDEECMIWMVPAKGEPIRWCRTTTITDAIADLVFGC